MFTQNIFFAFIRPEKCWCFRRPRDAHARRAKRWTMASISELINVQKISTANIYLSKRQSRMEKGRAEEYRDAQQK